MKQSGVEKSSSGTKPGHTIERKISSAFAEYEQEVVGGISGHRGHDGKGRTESTNKMRTFIKAQKEKSEDGEKSVTIV